MLDKQHKDLLRDIRIYIGYLGESKIAPSDFLIEALIFPPKTKNNLAS
jgi:phage regulator Rha-like protein